MSLALNLTITDNVTPKIADLIARTQPAKLARVLRQPLETFWRQHLKKFPRLPGRFAAMPPTGFGEAASRSVHGTVLGDGVLLRADKQGLAQRYHGGEIKPVNKKFLCFGIKPESYGKTVWDFGYTPRQPGETRRSGFNFANRQRIRELFAFAKSVTQRPNPAVIPTQDELAEVSMAAIERSIGEKGPTP